ncbi:MAG: Rrf2 family transcriptional regulator [Candidatus Competibacteraceae bacterium]|nr:MAG: Rrf2 family transcriptional regulator [Candidatus Competibacteraceae bacterium]
MRLSTKGRYAVTAMMHLAIHDKRGPVTLAEISQCQGISLSYLEQLFAKLRKRSLVEGVRGPGGGYRLARSPDQVTVATIISAVDERIDATRCCGNENCQNGQRCLTHKLWTDLSRQIFNFLEGITLAQFVDHPASYDLLPQHQSGSRRRERSSERFIAPAMM